MKMKPETYAALKAAVVPIMKHMAPLGELNRRKQWDCLWASKFPVSRLYDEGLYDNHIETALRAIAAEFQP
jgi:hypothetical protein